MRIEQLDKQEYERVNSILVTLSESEDSIFATILGLYFCNIKIQKPNDDEIQGIQTLLESWNNQDASFVLDKLKLNIIDEVKLTIDYIKERHLKVHNKELHIQDDLIALLEKLSSDEYGLLNYTITDTTLTLALSKSLFLSSFATMPTCRKTIVDRTADFVQDHIIITPKDVETALNIWANNKNDSNAEIYIDIIESNGGMNIRTFLAFVIASYSDKCSRKQTSILEMQTLLNKFNDCYKTDQESENIMDFAIVITDEKLIEFLQEFEKYGVISVLGDIRNEFEISIPNDVKNYYFEKMKMNATPKEIRLLVYTYLQSQAKIQTLKGNKKGFCNKHAMQESINKFGEVEIDKINEVIQDLINLNIITLESDLSEDTFQFVINTSSMEEIFKDMMEGTIKEKTNKVH